MAVGIYEVLSFGVVPEITGNDVSVSVVSKSALSLSFIQYINEMSKTVTVYGATAFTAGPVIEYLDDHPDSGQYKLILSGRNLEKLDKIQAKLSKKVEIVALELSDEKGLRALVDRSDVIINVAGKL